jgi:pimeloyl-ACP methyl ester carboxylesterase
VYSIFSLYERKCSFPLSDRAYDFTLRERTGELSALPHRRRLDAGPCQFPDMTPRLADVRVPTLLVWGREDRVVPLGVGLGLLSGLHDNCMSSRTAATCPTRSIPTSSTSSPWRSWSDNVRPWKPDIRGEPAREATY